PKRTAWSFLALLVLSCSRERTHYARAGIADHARRAEAAIGPTEPDSAANEADTAALPVAYGEASRRRVDRWDQDSVWAKEADVVREPFERRLDDTRREQPVDGGAAPAPVVGALTAQSISLSGGRRALLLAGADTEARPLVLVQDRDGALLWSKNRPLAGTLP